MATDISSETAILERIVFPHGNELSEQIARYFLDLSFSSEDRERMQELADKAKAGTLTPAEEHSIENYERVGTFLSILKSQARRVLRSAGHAVP